MSDQTKKPVYINRENFTDKIKSYLRHPGSMILMFLVMLATFITFCTAPVPDFLYFDQWNSVY